MDQAVFETVYRGRQGSMHHLAYMRTGKVFLVQRALEACGIQLDGKSLFDYGFGSGTFFRHCPPSTDLNGVEIDPSNVEEVTRSLAAKGRRANLQTIAIGSWSEHPMLSKQYDIFLCSHVLEHLPAPADFLRRVRSCISLSGHFVGLVPLNERTTNPHHVSQPNRSMIKEWADQAGYTMSYYEENDPFLYWFQPLFAVDTGWRHFLAKGLSLGIGVSATLLGRRIWFSLANLYAHTTFSLPTQAIFLLKPQ